MKGLGIVLFFIPLFSDAQSELPTKDGKVFYEIVDSSVSGSQKELYDRAKLWMVDIFRSANAVIQLDDKDNSILVGKGVYTFTHNMVPFSIRFTIKINTKENKYRAQIYDLLVGWNHTTEPRPIENWLGKKSAKGWVEKTDNGIKEIIQSLKGPMSKKTDSDF